MKIKPSPLLLAFLASVTAVAQQPQPRPPQGQPLQPVNPLLAALDKNRDGEISAEELKSASQEVGKLDRNGDGKIDRQELRQPLPQGNRGPQNGPQNGPQARPMLPPVFIALDADHDGEITAEELANATTTLKTLDKDGDGVLSPMELFHMGPPPRDDNQGDPRRPQGPPQGPPPQDQTDPPGEPQPEQSGEEIPCTPPC